MSEFDDAAVFPTCPAFDFTSKPSYRTAITQLAGGDEYRVSLWSRPLFDYEGSAVRKHDAIALLQEHFNAMSGMMCGFPFKDYADFKSCLVSDTPAATDQPLIQVDSESWQLVKDYTAGSRTQRRYIFKPIPGTILIANEDGDVQSDTAYELDPTTGLLVPSSDFDGEPSTWGGQFYVPVRYDADELAIVIINKDIHSVSFGLSEIRL